MVTQKQRSARRKNAAVARAARSKKGGGKFGKAFKKEYLAKMSEGWGKKASRVSAKKAASFAAPGTAQRKAGRRAYHWALKKGHTKTGAKNVATGARRSVRVFGW